MQITIVINLTDVVDIRKNTHSNNISNAIEVETIKETILFGSITSKKDEKFSILNRVWDFNVEVSSN